jgi:hypothetical protein
MTQPDTLENRAMQACMRYDRVKTRIDELTERIADLFHECETRQIQESDEDDINPFEDVEPCLSFVGNIPCDTRAHYDDECDYCPKALKAIRERRELRQEFGAAKRQIRALAKSFRDNKED